MPAAGGEPRAVRARDGSGASNISSGGIDAPFKYLEYTGGGPWLYVDKTARWATEYDPPFRA